MTEFNLVFWKNSQKKKRRYACMASKTRSSSLHTHSLILVVPSGTQGLYAQLTFELTSFSDTLFDHEISLISSISEVLTMCFKMNRIDNLKDLRC